MTKGAVGGVGMMIALLLMPACSSNESGSPPASSGIPSRSTGSTTTPDEERPSLVGGHTRSYTRHVRGVTQTKSFSPGQRLWGIKVIPSEVRNRGVFLLSYLGRPPGTFRGRAYEYSSDDKILSLGEATKPKDVAGDIGDFKLVLGGLTCPPGPAIYSWRLFDDDLRLRLRAIQESCAVRRAILVGDWRFSD
jgi:hypothetical protein